MHVHLFNLFYLVLFALSLGYVDEMRRQLLYHCNKAGLKKTYDMYKAKEPNTLTSQFSDRRTKEEAVRNQAQRKARTTELFSSGQSCYIIFKVILVLLYE